MELGITWTYQLLTSLVSLSPWELLKNGNDIIWTSSKIYFPELQDCGSKNEPTTPIWNLKLNFPYIINFEARGLGGLATLKITEACSSKGC